MKGKVDCDKRSYLHVTCAKLHGSSGIGAQSGPETFSGVFSRYSTILCLHVSITKAFDDTEVFLDAGHLASTSRSHGFVARTNRNASQNWAVKERPSGFTDVWQGLGPYLR